MYFGKSPRSLRLWGDFFGEGDARGNVCVRTQTFPRAARHKGHEGEGSAQLWLRHREFVGAGMGEMRVDG